MGKIEYIPETPGGTLCTWLTSRTEKEAIKKLLKDASHMPYDGWNGFQQRGYKIIKLRSKQWQ